MVAPDKSPQDLLPLTPAVFHILLALSDGERHGYAIMREIERSTDGMVRMGPGTLYGTIKRAIAAGLVEESDERPDPEMDDERRRYYRMTAFGRWVASAEAERLDRLVTEAKAKRLLPGEAGHSLVVSVPGLARLPQGGEL
jgi:DNA-binding PadR family transcriptional regulator